MTGKNRRRIAVTGLGSYVPNGRNIAEFRSNLFAGVDGIREITEFDATEYRSSRGGVIESREHEEIDLDPRCDRACQLALVAAREALTDSGLTLDGELAWRTAVSVGSSLGGMLNHERSLRTHHRNGGEGPPEDLYGDVLEIPPCQIAGFLAREFGVYGGSATVVTACAAGGGSIAAGADMIRHGRADVVIAVGTEPFSMLAYSGFNILMALSPGLCRPFDRNRTGLTVGEGAGALVLEEWGHAAQREAHVHAELSGYGLSNDAYHPTQPDPEGGGAVRAILRALRDAGRRPEEVGYVNAHGTATRHNDSMEIAAMSKVYGEAAKRIPVSSIKPLVGHTLGAAGTIEAIATILAVEDQYLPPTRNHQTPEEACDYDFVPEGRPEPGLEVACSHSFGFGGNAAVLVFERPRAAAQGAAGGTTP